jgi:hypothetical protein
MKFEVGQKIIALGFVFGFIALAFACNQQQKIGNAQNPTEAYKMLYAAVKTKDTDKIKMMFSKDTQGFAEFVAGQQKKDIKDVYANGFTATTFADKLPQIRDERVKDNMGAVEVYNEKDKKWEDLPFIKEDDGWKLAVGDTFKGTYQKPDKPQSEKEQEAANIANANMAPPNMANVKTNSAAVESVNTNSAAINKPLLKRAK